MPSPLEQVTHAAYRAVQKYAHRHEHLLRYVHPHGPGKPLVVMLHGFEGTPGEFRNLCKAMKAKAGKAFDVAVVDTLLPDPGPTPEENMERLDAFLTAHDLRERELYLVGHSTGGLTARCYSHREGIPHIRAIALVCTPNGGVNTGNIFPWIGSHDFDERFNVPYPVRAGIAHFQLYGTAGANVLEGIPNDNIVGRWSALRLLRHCEPEAEVTVKGYPLDHWHMMRDPQPLADIVDFLLATLAR